MECFRILIFKLLCAIYAIRNDGIFVNKKKANEYIINFFNVMKYLLDKEII